MHCLTIQGCGLRKITRSPEPPTHEILGAQDLGLYEKTEFSSRPKAKVSRMWHPDTSRAQPCNTNWFLAFSGDY